MKLKTKFSICVCAMIFNCMMTYANNSSLKYIGMPIGGICTGQVYIGGDGQLWNWDIFNIAGTEPGGAGDRFYLNPMRQQQNFANGFGIKIKQGLKTYYRALNEKGFNDIGFNGEYPVAKVDYKDSQLPVEVKLTAFSPFIPTDAENSGLPAILLSYEVTNTSNSELSVDLEAWMQNMSCFQSATSSSRANHINSVKRNGNYTQIILSADKELADKVADWGDMSITSLDANAIASTRCAEDKGTGMFHIDSNDGNSCAPLGSKLIGGIKSTTKLGKGESHTFTFVVSWFFPNINLWKEGHNWLNKENLRYFYSKQFSNSQEVAQYILSHSELAETTLLWNKVWYDSTLPKSLLDRSFANVSTLATTASQRFHDISKEATYDGRFYNFEGVYLGEGTCSHVTHYGQVLGRLFPSLAQDFREKVDLGLSYDKGIIKYRGEFSNIGAHDSRGYAVDGQAGCILGCYREHLMSENNDFLTRNWSHIKGAMSYMIAQDKEKTGVADGILEGVQYNTLDRMWYGKIAWTSGLYAAALRACAKMATVVGDRSFAKQCDKIALMAYNNMSKELFNGEYFIQILDKEHLETPNSNDGCHIDQLLGQYWASQLDLGYIVPKNEVLTSLKSIMKYNYVDDYEAFLAKTKIPVSRWYGDGHDEAGVIMCSFPHGGYEKAPGTAASDLDLLIVGYFSEMWTGQEHALASNLIAEGLTDDAKKVIDAINHRYSAERRNPYNEVEYGNHYTRAMSSYGEFISACGYFYNGPKKTIGFSPKLSVNDFKSAFVANHGWGTYAQKLTDSKNLYTLTVKYGGVQLGQFNVVSSLDGKARFKVNYNGKVIKSKIERNGENVSVKFAPLNLTAGDTLEIINEI